MDLEKAGRMRESKTYRVIAEKDWRWFVWVKTA